MAIILEFSLPAGALALGDVLEAVPGIEIELDRVVPTEQRTLPFFWVQADNLEAFERRAQATPSIEELRLVEEVGDRRLYEAHWNGGLVDVIDGIVDAEGTVLEAQVADGEWEFKLRFHEREHARQFQRHCVDNDLPLNLSKLYELSEVSFRRQYELTQKQYATLRLAHQKGYFDEPRATNLEALGDELDISPRAVSYRLRRGVDSLIEHTISSPERAAGDGR